MVRMDIEHVGVDYIEEHWDSYIKYGVSADKLAKRCCEGLIVNDNRIKKLLDKGVSVDTVYELSKSWLDCNNGWPERLSKTFRILHKHGLPSETIDSWLKSHITEDLVYDIIEECPSIWKKLGIQAEDYVDQWLDYFSKDFLGPYSLNKLPEAVSKQRFLEYRSKVENGKL